MSTSVGRAARQFGLSRTALLYYDRIGLLVPSARSRAGYRMYSDSDLERLAAICRYRRAGVPLEDIGKLLAGTRGTAAAILERRLDAVSAEIEALREQQRVIARLLAQPKKLASARTLSKESWVAILRSAGLDDESMHRWHIEFERMAPEAHAEFLSSLGISRAEVARIRRWSRPVP